MEKKLYFDNYRGAMHFLKKVGAGKIKPRTDKKGFLWDPDSGQLTQEQLEIIAEADGSKYLWEDCESGLSWLFRERAYYNIESLSNKCLGGYNDWRVPTLRELKTLACTTQNEFGLFAKESVGGRLKGNYISCTKDRQESVWWNFDTGQSEKEEYSDGKIKWDAGGDFAGFEKSVHHNFAKLILVRGTASEHLADWALKLRDWAEEDGVLDFPSTQENMESLEKLKLFYSKRIPGELSNLRNLKSLVCYAFPGSEKAIFSISSLEELKLLKPYEQACFKEIPSSVANLAQLLSLDAGEISIYNVHESIGNLKKLKHLNLNMLGSNSIPDSITNMHDLTTLRLAGVGALPNSIGDLKRLEKLAVFGRFESIPYSLVELGQLQELTIGSSNLNQLPEKIFKLEKLEAIRILKSNIETFPASLIRMPFLKELELSNSPIKELPEDISALKSLVRLDLRETNISHIPEQLKHLDNLRFLYLSNTKLALLPEWLKDMKSLSKIRAKGVKFPPALREKIVYLY